MNQPVKLPPHLIQEPERHISDLQPGETGYVEVANLRIDAEHNCYLNPDGKLLKAPSVIGLTVTRTGQGYTVVIAQNEPFRWSVWDTVLDPARYVPVTQITIEGKK